MCARRRKETIFCLATPLLSALFDRAGASVPVASREPGIRCREFASSSSATSQRPINTSVQRGWRGRREREPSSTLRRQPSSLHSNQIVAISPPFPPSAAARCPFFLFFFFSTFTPSLRVSCPATDPGYACSAWFGCVFVTRFSRVPGLTLYVSLRSRSLLPLLSPSSTSPGRPALLQMHRCSSLQGPAKKNGLPAAAGS